MPNVHQIVEMIVYYVNKKLFIYYMLVGFLNPLLYLFIKLNGYFRFSNYILSKYKLLLVNFSHMNTLNGH